MKEKNQTEPQIRKLKEWETTKRYNSISTQNCRKIEILKHTHNGSREPSR